MAQLIEAATGKPVEIPDAQVPAAFASGQYGLPRAPLHVKGPDGTVGDIDPEQAQEAFAHGVTIASPGEYKQAFLEHKYGGIGNGLAAFGEGAARGLTLGLSDPFAIAGARLFGGNETAEHVREHLEGEKVAHGIASLAGEVGGAAVPMLLGGSGAASEARALGSVADGVRTLGILPRMVGAAGDATEGAVASFLGRSAETAIGRAGQAAAKAAARAVTEGGLFGAGQAVSEASIEDKDLTAEKIYSAVSHSALTAGLLSGALAGAGSLASRSVPSVDGKLPSFASTLDDAAGDQAWRWLSPRANESREAVRRAGGTSAVGKAVLDEVLRPLIDKEGLMGAQLSAPEKLAAVQEAVDRKGQQIGALLKGNDSATVSLGEMLRPIDDAMKSTGTEILGGERVSRLKALRDSVLEVLGKDAPSPVQRTPEDLSEYLRAHPEAAEMLSATGKLPPEALFHPQAPLDELQVPIASAIQQRRVLQRIAYQETRSLDPNARVQMLRDIASSWNDIEEQALNRATEGAGTQLRELNKAYQRLKIAEAAAEKTTAAYGANATFSLGDKIFGAAHLTGALASGHPLAAAGSLATMYGHKWLRSHGNAYGAVLLDRLATMGGMSEAASQVDAQIDSSIDKLLSNRARAPRLFHTSLDFDDEAERTRALSKVAPPILSAHLQQQTQSLSTHSPEVAQAIQRQTASAQAFLQSKLPPTPLPDPLAPNKPPAYAPDDKRRFIRYVEAVNGGVPGILRRVADGTHTQEDVETLAALFPKSRDEIMRRLLNKAAEKRSPMSFQKRMRVSSILGPAADPSRDPGFMQAIQSSYASGQHAATSAEPTARKASSSAVQKMKFPDMISGTFELQNK